MHDDSRLNQKVFERKTLIFREITWNSSTLLDIQSLWILIRLIFRFEISNSSAYAAHKTMIFLI